MSECDTYEEMEASVKALAISIRTAVQQARDMLAPFKMGEIVVFRDEIIPFRVVANGLQTGGLWTTDVVIVNDKEQRIYNVPSSLLRRLHKAKLTCITGGKQ